MNLINWPFFDNPTLHSCDSRIFIARNFCGASTNTNHEFPLLIMLLVFQKRKRGPPVNSSHYWHITTRFFNGDQSTKIFKRLQLNKHCSSNAQWGEMPKISTIQILYPESHIKKLIFVLKAIKNVCLCLGKKTLIRVWTVQKNFFTLLECTL